MSRKLVHEWPLIVNGDMGGNITSSSYNVINVDNIGIQLVFTGTPTGSFSVEASNDNVNFAALDFGTPIPASGAPGDDLLNINQLPYSWIRVKYIFGSSTGVLNATITTKTIGA